MLMNASAPKEMGETSISANSAVESELRDLIEVERSKTVQVANAKMELDVGRIRSSIARLTSNSTDELGKLISELEALQKFLKSEAGRVQGEIENVLDGVKIIVEAISPWKTADVARTQNTRSSGHDKIKRWP
jgi:hypothetical protein